MEINQKPLIEDEVLPLIVEAPAALHKVYMEALAFAEEPVTIRIERSGEKFAPNVIDLWVNGQGAEILQNGRWVTYNALPVGTPVTTKRKYVEVLARSKTDTINTKSGKKDEFSEINSIERYTSAKAPFSVIRDKNPLGVEWLTNLLRSN
jgi:hypothetical protein